MEFTVDDHKQYREHISLASVCIPRLRRREYILCLQHTQK